MIECLVCGIHIVPPYGYNIVYPLCGTCFSEMGLVDYDAKQLFRTLAMSTLGVCNDLAVKAIYEYINNHKQELSFSCHTNHASDESK